MATSKPKTAADAAAPAPAPTPRPERIPDKVLIQAADTIHGEPLTGHTVTGGHVTAKNEKGQLVAFAYDAIISRMRELTETGPDGDSVESEHSADDQVVAGDGK